MKKTKYIIAFILALNILACETVDFGDTNKNINGATAPYTAGLLSSAIMSFATYTNRDGVTKPTLYVQYQSQVTYTDEMLYAEIPSSWFTWYVSCLSPLQSVIDFVSVPENQIPSLLAQGSVNNQIGTAMIMKAIIANRVADTYGDVPYSQALGGSETLIPPYDKQEDLYKLLISELKQARDMMSTTETAALGDILYGGTGSVLKWKKLANSMIMQISLKLSKQYPSPTGYAATEFKTALNDVSGPITTVADEAWFKYQDIVGYRNPWNTNRVPDYFLSREFTDALKGNATVYNHTSNHTNDVRLTVYATDATKNGVPYGHDDGTGSGASGMSVKNYWNNTTPLPLMTSSYVYLNRADAAQMGWTTEVVLTMLSTGITRSFETLDSHFATTVAASGPAYAAARIVDAGTVGNATVIAEEKWVSLFGNGFEAWTEWRRTGIPALVPAVDHYNDGAIPRRYLYPTEEASLNKESRDAGVSGLTPAADKGTSKGWWDK